MKKCIGTLVIALGIISGLVFFSAGSKFSETAENMITLTSESGTSLAEVYYQDVGGISKGLGLLSNALGIGIIAISIGYGAKIYYKDVKDVKQVNDDKEAEKII